MRNSLDGIDRWKLPLRGVVYIAQAQSCRMGTSDTNARCDSSVSRISAEQPRSPSLRIAGAAGRGRRVLAASPSAVIRHTIRSARASGRRRRRRRLGEAARWDGDLVRTRRHVIRGVRNVGDRACKGE
jgi:hypothetical protein